MGMISVILISDAKKDGKLIEDEISEDVISSEDSAKNNLNSEQVFFFFLKAVITNLESNNKVNKSNFLT
jgi:hypothetical protein